MIFWDNVKSLFNTGSQCVFCGREIAIDERVCDACKADEQKFYEAKLNKNELSYIYQYDGVIKKLLHSLKYNDDIKGAYYIADIMAKELGKIDVDLKNCVITNVPIHKNRLKSRGFDQCEVIAKQISKLNGALYLQLFKRVKNTKPQYTLNARERAQNMSGAFEFVETDIDLTEKTVILIDDIYTTGSTLRECVKLLPDNTTVLQYVFAKEN